MIEDLAETSDDATALQVCAAMFGAVDREAPGEPAPFSKTGSLRVIRTPAAEIHLEDSELGGP